MFEVLGFIATCGCGISCVFGFFAMSSSTTIGLVALLVGVQGFLSALLCYKLGAMENRLNKLSQSMGEDSTVNSKTDKQEDIKDIKETITTLKNEIDKLKNTSFPKDE